MHFSKHSRQQRKPNYLQAAALTLPGKSPRSHPIFETDKTKRTNIEMIASKQNKNI